VDYAASKEPVLHFVNTKDLGKQFAIVATAHKQIETLDIFCHIKSFLFTITINSKSTFGGCI